MRKAFIALWIVFCIIAFISVIEDRKNADKKWNRFRKMQSDNYREIIEMTK